MANSKYEICSNALVLVGAAPINGFTQASTEEIIAEQLYESTLMNLIASYRWRFASQYVELNRLSGSPAIIWTAQYQLPAGTVMLHGVYADGQRISFDRVGDRIYCDAIETEDVTALIGFRPDEQLFPPYFSAVLELQLAARFAVPIAEDMQKASLYEGMAMRQFAQARSIESQGRTPQKMPLRGLRRLHRGGA